MCKSRLKDRYKQNCMCPYCETSIHDFKSHAFKDGVNSLCNICDLAVPNQKCVDMHLKLVHKSPTEFVSCIECSIDFSSKKFLKIHNGLCHSESFKPKILISKLNSNVMEIHQCQYCDVILPRKEDLLKHMDNANHTASKCECESSIKAHEKVCKSKDFKCNACEESFELATQLLKHRFAIHITFEEKTKKAKVHAPGKTGQKILAMKFCNDNEVPLIENVDRKDEEGKSKVSKNKNETIYKCDQCDKSFEGQNAEICLELHLGMHKTFDKDVEKSQTETVLAQVDEEKSPSKPKKIGLQNHGEVSINPTFLSNNSPEQQKESSNVRRVHKNKKNFKCEKCTKTFGRLPHLRRHIKIIHEGIKEFECKDCKIAYGQKTQLDNHLFKVHISIQNNSQNMDTTIANHEKAMLTKESSKQQQIFTCKECSKMFNAMASLRKHVEIIHQMERKFKCIKCEKSFGQSGTLKTHIKTIHEGIKNYKCKKCSAAFANLMQHNLHFMKAHHRDMEDNGKKSLKNEGEKIVFSKGKSKVQSCQECMKKFSSIHILRMHIKIVHQKEKNFKCQKCAKFFGQPAHLKRHYETIHEGKKKFKCKVCPAEYAQQTQLDNHLVKHFT